MTGLMVQMMELIILVTMSSPKLTKPLAAETESSTRVKSAMTAIPITETAATPTVSLSAASTVMEPVSQFAETDSRLSDTKSVTPLMAALSTAEPSLSTNATRLTTDAGTSAETPLLRTERNVMEVTI